MRGRPTSRASADRGHAGRGALRDDLQYREPQRGDVRGVLDLIEVRRLAGSDIGLPTRRRSSPGFETMIEKVRRRRLQ